MFLSLKRLPGIYIEMIDKWSIQMPNIITKGDTKPLYHMIIAKTAKQKLNNQYRVGLA